LGVLLAEDGEDIGVVFVFLAFLDEARTVDVVEGTV
jgi:hypothetical protein